MFPLHMLLLLTKMIWSKHISNSNLYCSGVGIQALTMLRIFLEFKKIVTNVAIAHVTIAHEDEQIKAHKK